MKKLILPIFTLVLLSIRLDGQTSAAFQRAGEKYFAESNYYGAMMMYGNMLQIDSSDARALKGFAEAAQMQGAFEEAETAFQKLYDRKKGRDSRAAYFLGGILQERGKYDEAKMRFEEFLKTAAPADSSYISLTNERIRACDYAIRHGGQPNVDIEITRLPEPINTEHGEYAPFLEGDLLYFSSNREDWEGDKNYPKRPIWKVFSANLSENGSETAKTDFNQKDLHTANSFFSPDGKYVFLIHGKYVGEAKIEAKLIRGEKQADGTFGNFTMLNEPLNSSTGTSTEPCFGLDADGNAVLFFASDRPGGRGGRDIYLSKMNASGEFSAPENLTEINTTGDEITPFWDRRSNIFYFSTTGRATLGGFDIYQAEWKNGRFSNITHLLAPVNSNYNDAYYFVSADDSEAYFASNRPEFGAKRQVEAISACCFDIFKAKNLGIELEAITFLKSTKNQLTGTKVRLLEFDENKNVVDEVIETIDNPLKKFKVERNKNYWLIAEKPDHTLDTVRFSTINLPPTERKIVKNLFLEPALIDLTAFTFDKNTGLALTGVTIRFEEIFGGNFANTRENLTANDFFYSLNFGRKYRIIASKNGYESDTVEVSTQGFDRFVTRHLTEKLYLKPVAFQSFLPLAVFFDNDEPDKDVTRATTNTTYGQSFDAYYSQKSEFVRQWVKANPEMNQLAGASNMDEFFEARVLGGWEKLKSVSQELEKRCQNGATIQLVIKGFASPRSSNSYNKALTGRRVWSLKNHFSTWNGGALKKYIDNGQLVFTEELNGEETAPRDIIAEINDPKNSVFSLRASWERRVEIVDINILKQGSVFPR
jgi:hypothetical protein